MGKRSMRLKSEKGGEVPIKLEKEERTMNLKDIESGISATSTPLKASKKATLPPPLDLDLSITTSEGAGKRMSPVPEEEDSGYSSFLAHSPETSPTLEQALLLPLLDEQEGRRWTDLYTQHLDSDYDLDDLVRCLKIKCGPLPVLPPSTSPPTSLSEIAASPFKLFGNFSSSLSSKLPPLPPKLGWKGPPSTHSGSPTPSSKPEEVETPPSVWSGQLPPKTRRNPSFSNKIFLGGVPWDVTEASLVQAFRWKELHFLLKYKFPSNRQFGPIRIEWPGKDNSPSPPKGYVYIIFDQVFSSC